MELSLNAIDIMPNNYSHSYMRKHQGEHLTALSTLQLGIEESSGLSHVDLSMGHFPTLATSLLSYNLREICSDSTSTAKRPPELLKTSFGWGLSPKNNMIQNCCVCKCHNPFSINQLIQTPQMTKTTNEYVRDITYNLCCNHRGT